MSNKLVNFAIAKSIYSERKNYLDTFSPFIIKVIAEQDKELNIEQVDKILNEKFEVAIPIHTLKSIFSLLSNQKLIDLDKSNNYSIGITNKGNEFYQETIENEKQISRRHSKLIKVFQEFAFQRFNTKYEISGVEKDISKYIIDNLLALVYYTFDETNQKLLKSDEKEFANHFSEFICNIEVNEPELFETFQELLKGAILWNEITHKENVEKETEFDDLIIYLDANYVISLFGLESPIRKKGADQLFNLLRRNKKLKIKVYKITLDEITRLLNEYKHYQSNYFDIPVDHIFSFLKRKGFDDAGIDLFISNFHKKCEEYGIEIEGSELLKPEKFTSAEKELYENLYQYNTELNKKNLKTQRREIAIHNSTLHDITVVSFIKKRRGSWIKNLEDSKFIFLTSSSRLDRFINKASKTNNIFPETVLDVTLTNILWLKNPENDIGCSIQHIINLHSKNYLVDNGIWRKFIATIKELRRKEKIDDQDYAYLISNNQLTFDYLKVSEKGKITPSQVLDLRDKIISDQIVTEEVLNRSKELLHLKEKELSDVRKHTSSLQSQLDKTKNIVKAEQSDKEKLYEKINELTSRLNLRDYQELKEKEVQKLLIIEMSKIKQSFWKSIFWWCIVLVLVFVAYEIIDSDDIKTYLGISNIVASILKGLFAIIAFIITNWIISKNPIKTFKWLFRKTDLRRELEKNISNNFELSNPLPKANQDLSSE